MPIHTSGYFTRPTASPLSRSGSCELLAASASSHGSAARGSPAEWPKTAKPDHHRIRGAPQPPSFGTYNDIVDDLLLPAGTVLQREIEVKRSRFLTKIVRVHSPQEARLQITSRREKMPDARHHCTAFAVAVPGSSPILHSSDDGEPSGTAGRPILEVVRGIPLIDVVAIVTRYFGGTLLGTGGLVRAYSDAVKECLEGATLLERHVVPVWETLLPHADGGRYLSELASAGFLAEPEYLAEGVRARIATAAGEGLAELLARLSSGALRISQTGNRTVETHWGTIGGGNAMPHTGTSSLHN